MNHKILFKVPGSKEHVTLAYASVKNANVVLSVAFKEIHSNEQTEITK